MRIYYWLLAFTAFLVLGCATGPKVQKEIGTDFHVHVHSPNNSGDDMEFDAERALFAVDSIELQRALILPNGYQKNSTETHTRQENDFVNSQVEKNPSRLAGACAVNPSKPWALRELKRCHSLNMKVLKVHFMASGLNLQIDSDYKMAKAFLEEASALGFAVLIHAHYPSQRRGDEILKLKQLIDSFPEIRWIIGHLFGREHEHLRSLNHTNFFVEISAVPIWMKTPEQRKALVQTIRTVGVKHFVFGSDWPVFHPAETLKYLRLLGLTESELNAILYENALQLNDLFKAN